MEILRVEDLSFKYPASESDVLKDINFSVEEGEFVVICGESGCGKTTLLRLLKKAIAPAGTRSGRIMYKGCDIEALEDETEAREIGYVFQNPDNQIVTDKVWHELSFGLENLGLPTENIRRRVGETASYFGIGNWFRKNTDELSGGQKQLLNLASVTVMQPDLLILDEPCAQLDPIAAADFISTLKKLNREMALTVIIVEHRLEELFSISDKVMLMEHGEILVYDTPAATARRLTEINEDHPMLLALPSAVRIGNALKVRGDCPISVREGRAFLESNFASVALKETMNYTSSEDVMIELRDVCFRYEKDLPDVMRNVSLSVRRGEIYCILGENGSGKSTTLNVAAGLCRAYHGKILIDGRRISDYKGGTLYRNMLALLSQNPQSVFICESVREDLADSLDALNVPISERDERMREVCDRLGIGNLLDRHPYDLSGGETQKCALAKLLLSKPKILLLDEPTKGLDAFSKRQLKLLLRALADDGITVVAVTHDVEFAAENADRCALFFDGEILSVDVPERFFAENSFYTTSANRMARRLWKRAITCEDVIKECRRQIAARTTE